MISNVINVLSTDEFFGEMSMLGLGLTTASAIAVNTATIYIIDIKDLLRLFEKNYYLATKFFKSLGIHISKRINAMNSKQSSDSMFFDINYKDTSTDTLRKSKHFLKGLENIFSCWRNNNTSLEYSCSLERKKGRLKIFPSHLLFSYSFFGYTLKVTRFYF